MQFYFKKVELHIEQKKSIHWMCMLKHYNILEFIDDVKNAVSSAYNENSSSSFTEILSMNFEYRIGDK